MVSLISYHQSETNEVILEDQELSQSSSSVLINNFKQGESDQEEVDDEIDDDDLCRPMTETNQQYQQIIMFEPLSASKKRVAYMNQQTPTKHTLVT